MANTEIGLMVITVFSLSAWSSIAMCSTQTGSKNIANNGVSETVGVGKCQQQLLSSESGEEKL